jgi:hypothetical protein
MLEEMNSKQSWPKLNMFFFVDYMARIKFCQIDLFSHFGSLNIAFKFDVITNLTCNELKLKIVQSSFIYRFIQLTHEYHALKTCLTNR